MLVEHTNRLAATEALINILSHPAPIFSLTQLLPQMAARLVHNRQISGQLGR